MAKVVKRILLVEDEQIACFIMELMLELLHCTVDIARDGKKAVELACSNQYDLILMDIGLPQLDGINACIAIKRYETTNTQLKSAPVVAVTANLDFSQIDSYMQAGMTAVLFKPITRQRLANLLEKISC